MVGAPDAIDNDCAVIGARAGSASHQFRCRSSTPMAEGWPLYRWAGPRIAYQRPSNGFAPYPISDIDYRKLLQHIATYYQPLHGGCYVGTQAGLGYPEG